jgi:hypothetical protein
MFWHSGPTAPPKFSHTLHAASGLANSRLVLYSVASERGINPLLIKFSV